MGTLITPFYSKKYRDKICFYFKIYGEYFKFG